MGTHARAGQMLGPLVTVAALTIAYNAYVLWVVRHLDGLGCPCARDWRLRFITGFTVFKLAWVALIVALLAGGALKSGAGARVPAPLQALGLLVSAATLANMIIALTYLTRLRQEQCECSEFTARTVWEVLLWLYVAWWAVMLLLSIATVAVTGAALRGAASRVSTRRRR